MVFLKQFESAETMYTGDRRLNQRLHILRGSKIIGRCGSCDKRYARLF